MTRIGPSKRSVSSVKSVVPFRSSRAVSGFLFETGHDSFPSQFGILEIEQQRHFQPSDVEITEHLRHVCVVEVTDDFWVGDDLSSTIRSGTSLPIK